MIDLPISQTRVHDKLSGPAPVAAGAAPRGSAGAGRHVFTLGHGETPKPQATSGVDPAEDLEVETEGATADAEGTAPLPVPHHVWATMNSDIPPSTNLAILRADAFLPPLYGATPGAPDGSDVSPPMVIAAAGILPSQGQDALPQDTGARQGAGTRADLAVAVLTDTRPGQSTARARDVVQPVATALVAEALPSGMNMSVQLNLAPSGIAETGDSRPGTERRLPVPFRLMDAFDRPADQRRSDAYRALDQRIPRAPGMIDTSVPPPPPVVTAPAYFAREIAADRGQVGPALDILSASATISGSLTGSFGGNATAGIAGAGVVGSGAAVPSPAVVTAQIATALSQTPPPGVIELTLSPAELGPLRIAMQASDGIMMVAISADNAQTLDLLRRNSDLLLQEFRNLGHSNVAFQFSGSSSREHGRRAQDGRSELAGLAPIATLPITATPAPRVKADGLDLRL